MGRSDRRHDPVPRLEVLAVVFANLLPLVGVVGFGWNVAALVVLYWLELGVLCFWAIVRAAFAARPSEFDPDLLIAGPLASKGVGLPIPRTGLEVRLSTLPALAVAVPVLALVWFLAGVTTVGIVDADSLAPGTLEAVSIAGVGIFVSEGVSTGIDYFLRREYREHSAQTAIRGAFLRGVVLGVVGMVTVFLAAAAGPAGADRSITATDGTVVGVPLLAGIVLVKLGFDLAGLYQDRLVEFEASLGGPVGWPDEPPPPDRLDSSLLSTARRLRPTLRARMLGGLSHASRCSGAWRVGAFPFLVAVLFAFGGAWRVVIAFLTASVVVPVLLAQIDYWLRYGTVEYRVGDDAIVAYDRLFRTPLWCVEPWDESGLRVERDRVDHWLETSTVVIERVDEDLVLPRLRAADPILEVFDRRPTGSGVDG